LGDRSACRRRGQQSDAEDTQHDPISVRRDHGRVPPPSASTNFYEAERDHALPPRSRQDEAASQRDISGSLVPFRGSAGQPAARSAILPPCRIRNDILITERTARRLPAGGHVAGAPTEGTARQTVSWTSSSCSRPVATASPSAR